MAVVSHLRSVPRAGAGAGCFIVPTDWAADFARQQLAVAAESACAVFRGFLAIRRIQEQAAQQALDQHAAAAERLRQPCGVADLVALQSQLARQDVEGATRYWQQLAGAVLEMHTELAGCAAHLVDTEDVFAAARVLQA